MKCNEAEKWILLQDSGEKTAKHTGALAAHLHDCEPCRRFQHALVESQDIYQAAEKPSAAVLNHINREARRLVPEKLHAKIMCWKPALALAASLMIGLGIFFSNTRPDTIGLELIMTEAELLDTSDQITLVMYDGLSEDDLAFNFLMTYEEES
jgi:predicted anti-sigma-YlaC factor YlaD